jgi:hypothetical protein
MHQAPFAVACTAAPKEVFGGEPPRFLPADEPGCAPFQGIAIEGDKLKISIDRSTLPPEFDGLETWSVVLGLATNEGTWSTVTVMPADLPDPIAPRATP